MNSECPYETEEYQKFVESMVPYCHCVTNRPCEGVLAGGMCDEIGCHTDPFFEYREDDEDEQIEDWN